MKFLSKVDFDNLDTNPQFKKYVEELYAESNGFDYQLARYRKLYLRHSSTYQDNVLMFSSPGRIEICGNHTDHNNGLVLCASISLDTIACVTPTNDSTVTVASEGYPPVVVDIKDLKVNKNEYGTSEALVRGVAAYFKEHGYIIGGFHATTTSDVFKGAGVSSSACFEVLISEIFNVLFNEGKIDPQTKVFASHCAESKYFGKPCGLMDQSAIAFGNVSYIDFKNAKKPIVETVDWPFKEMRIMICNCGGDHCNLTDEYAAIRSDMEAIAMSLGCTTLREVSPALFSANLPTLTKRFNSRQITRAIHYFMENRRVKQTVASLKKKSVHTFKRIINESGHSSFEMLQNCFVPGSLDQPISFALAYARSLRKGSTAIRVHGGGFAGTIIGFTLTRAYFNTICINMSRVFGEENIHGVSVRRTGTQMLEL